VQLPLNCALLSAAHCWPLSLLLPSFFRCKCCCKGPLPSRLLHSAPLPPCHRRRWTRSWIARI
jgi:hypothetical protein